MRSISRLAAAIPIVLAIACGTGKPAKLKAQPEGLGQIDPAAEKLLAKMKGLIEETTGGCQKLLDVAINQDPDSRDNRYGKMKNPEGYANEVGMNIGDGNNYIPYEFQPEKDKDVGAIKCDFSALKNRHPSEPYSHVSTTQADRRQLKTFSRKIDAGEDVGQLITYETSDRHYHTDDNMIKLTKDHEGKCRLEEFPQHGSQRKEYKVPCETLDELKRIFRERFSALLKGEAIWIRNHRY